jgi:drug/metabolite transporter (DMT)-like permease
VFVAFVVEGEKRSALVGVELRGGISMPTRVRDVVRALFGVGRRKHDEDVVKAVYALRATLFLLAWGVSSALIIMVNDAILNEYGFPYPIAVSMTGPLFSWIVASGLLMCGVIKLERKLSLREWLTQVFPIGFFTAVTFAAGNQLYLYLSVSFIQMMKSLSPCVVFFMLVLCGLDRVTKEKVVSVLVMTVGMAVACATEETFTALGLFLMFLGEASEAVRMVLFQHFMDNRGFGLMEGLFYTCPANFFFLALGVAIFEQREIVLNDALSVVRANPWPFILVSFLGFAVIWTTLGVIKTCGSLTFKAAGQVRNVAIIMLSVVFKGEKTSPLQLCGYAMNVFGFAYYQTHKSKEDIDKQLGVHASESSDFVAEHEKLLDSPRSNRSNGSMSAGSL